MGKHYRQLDLDEGIELSRLHEDGRTRSEIARIMGRHPTTIGLGLIVRALLMAEVGQECINAKGNKALAGC